MHDDDPEDILNDSLAFLGGQPVIDDDIVRYGPLSLQIAPKEGKLIPIEVIELGAGSGLPSLLLASMPQHPALIVVTDYPDENILGNLKKNLENNRQSLQPGCHIQCVGYEWGKDVGALLELARHLPNVENAQHGYEAVILSDLLHFHGSHDVLISSIQTLLSHSKDSKVHVSAGKYTHRNVCDDFLRKAKDAGFVFEEVLASTEEATWRGTMKHLRHPGHCSDSSDEDSDDDDDDSSFLYDEDDESPDDDVPLSPAWHFDGNVHELKAAKEGAGGFETADAFDPWLAWNEICSTSRDTNFPNDASAREREVTGGIIY
ncbi:hypothetical protein DXG01_003783 [Tephrocybe rancida]|nr:hypothetical protein DXG01_003783 [Tephrocybe rancida]